MAWHRHQGDSKFHAGAPGSGSFITLCNGRWPLTDAANGEVEQHPSPPHDERCECCQRHAIDVRRIESGFRELVRNVIDNVYAEHYPNLAAARTTRVLEWSPFDLSDVVGGEA